jgi:hypothetical protein
MALPFTLKTILRQKEELWKLNYFHHAKTIILKIKNPLKETKILQEIITLELISSFNRSQNYHASKNPHIKK